MKPAYQTLLVILILLVTQACQPHTSSEGKGQPIDNGSRAKRANQQVAPHQAAHNIPTQAHQKALLAGFYGDHNIPSQTFTIDPSKAQTIRGANGSVLQIPAGIFVDGRDAPVQGEVVLELKEALGPLDQVLGNLTTTHQGRPLQSGGMLCLQATAGGKPVHIARGGAIETTVPTTKRLKGMSLFQGHRDANHQMQWNNPVPIPEPAAPKADDEVPVVENEAEPRYTITYSVDGFKDDRDYPIEVLEAVEQYTYKKVSPKILRDSMFQVGAYTVRVYKQERGNKTSVVKKTLRGTNEFRTDQEMCYVFQLKQLGWANIDRLYHDPRTEEVELFTYINNEGDFPLIYTTMVTESMYLPGYQREDDSFSFTHGDYEAARLPIGAKATIIATAYRDGQPYFAYQTLEIQKQQAIDLELKATSKEELTATLEAVL